MKFLVIQTAFLGDVILITSVIEKLHRFYPDAKIDILVRKGNEGVLTGHPYIKTLHTWDKKNNKYRNLMKLIAMFRKEHYDHVLNFHRFAASGLITLLSGAKNTAGFNKNPFSFLFGRKVQHVIGTSQTVHEIQRNLKLIEHLTDTATSLPKLYPSAKDYEMVKDLRSKKYICIAPASVWFTKQLPVEKWIALIGKIKTELPEITVYLLGSAADQNLCNIIRQAHESTLSLAGELTILQTAALMEGAAMNYVNDSAPLHIASSMNAPVTAFFCSTVPSFGFTPLSDNSRIVETDLQLSCRPCGLHGYAKCPLGHFRCATTIDMNAVTLPQIAGIL